MDADRAPAGKEPLGSRFEPKAAFGVCSLSAVRRLVRRARARAGRHALPSTDGMRGGQCAVQWVWGYSPRPTPSLWTPLTPTHPRPLCGRPCSERVTYVESHACDLCIQRLSPSVVCPRSVLVRVLWPSGSPLCARATLLIQPHVRGRPDDSHLWKFARRAFVSLGAET